MKRVAFHFLFKLLCVFVLPGVMANKSGLVLAAQRTWPVIALLFFFSQAAYSNHNDCGEDPNTFDVPVIQYQTGVTESYCVLCGTGQIRILITNPSTGDMDNFSVTHYFMASGLEYVPGSTTVSVNGAGAVAAGNPDTSVAQQLTWDSGDIPALASISSSPNHFYDTVEIIFQVRSPAGNEEDLVDAVRNVEADAAYTFCPGTADEANVISNTGLFDLNIWEAEPVIRKRGRNIDAAQGGYIGGTTYGNINDDVIWQIRIRNNGRAALQELLFDDRMGLGNFDINYICPSNGQAVAVANNDGVAPGGSDCIAVADGNVIDDFDVDDPFGNPANDEPGAFIDVPATANSFYFLVGKITNSCNANTTNTANDVQWGCEGVGGQAGITETSTNTTGGSSSTTLSSLVNNNGLNIQREFIGTNLTQPAGSKGTVRITITNNTGGSVKNINLTNILPPEYVMDSSFEPTINMNPRFGNYPGMTDTITWTNPILNTDTYNPAVVTPSTDPLDYLANIAPEFSLTSSDGVDDVNPDYPDQFNMMRHGDVITITFRVVMVPTAGYDPYDLSANLDVREEVVADGTDPSNATTITNQLDVTFEQFCNPGVTQTLPTFNDNFNTNPEDLDIDITGTELIFILTNDTTTPLPLEVSLTNRGGHDANDYVAYVTFGATMDVVVTPPTECTLTTNPPLLEVWDDPADLPATASVYACSSADIGAIAPGATVPLNFTVTKSSDAVDLALDDLSFRADVVGEITLSDSTPLWFPVPRTTTTVPATQIDNRANNYSLDGVRARVIGFNLIKAQQGNCSETTYTPASDLEVQIGEECTYHIETGGWFGFQTPGFTYIAVQNIDVWDQQPNGQAYISNTDPILTSDMDALKVISRYPATLTPLFEGGPVLANWFGWTFNPVVPFVNPGHTNRIIVRDKWFRVDTTTRLLNDPQNASGVPNQHSLLSSNILNSTFQAVFFNDVLGVEEVFSLGQNTIGYPQEILRRVDLTVTEPNISIVKEVCNETLNVAGPGCGAWTTLANDGDTEDSYIYRITLTNESAASGPEHAPAYNLTSTDILDDSDMMLVVDFATDGLDNDGDGLTELDGDTDEGSISDNIVENGTPATITFSHTHSDALLQINPGSTPIYFYYRVNPDDSIAPGQQLTNTVTMTYDTLDGDTGSQTVDPRPNGELGGARVYTTAAAQATVEILPLITQPKTILNLSNTTLTGAQPQGVSIGEEIEYQLQASIPVAKLDNFEIRDELPAGISCVDVPEVVLDTTYFSPGGIFNISNGSITCNDNLVHWNFGDQELIGAPDSTSRFDFLVSFIARVENSAANNNGITISNGTPATIAYLRYTNDDPSLPAQVTLNYGQHDIIVQEPTVVLTKSMDLTNADASDVITVTVTAENTGTATAYNLRVLDDLVGTNLTYLGNISGTDPPDSIDTATFGVNQPVFTWNSLAPGTTYTFSFDVSVDTIVQPDEILDNTIQSDWTSLPSQATALNSSGLIAVDGDPLGMRIGTLPNVPVVPGDPNDYQATATDSATVPPLTMTKIVLPPALPAEIGAHKNFQVEIVLPEGVTNNLVVTDNLAFGGQSYVLSNNTDFDVTYTFQNIASINGQPPAEAVLNAFAADGTSGNAIWDIGTIVTDAEDDTTVTAVNPVIRINYYARLNNDLDTGVGDTLQNSVDVNYINGESGLTEILNDVTPAITAIEPLLTVVKTVDPVTPVTGSDTIEYTVTINNIGNATAYDVNIVDTLPAELAWYASTPPTVTINGGAVTGFVSTPGGAPAGPLVWGRDNGDESLDIPAGGELILVYTAQVQPVALPGVIFNNSVIVDWTSLDGSSNYERDGAGCPTVTAPDIYCAGPVSADMSIIEPDSMTLEKSGPAILGVGVPASFTLNIHNTGGAAAYDATITDLIPNPVPGGMCDDTPPGNFNIDITEANLAPVSTLTEGVDYTVNFVTGNPNCTLTFTILTPTAALPADNRYIITYDAYLDADTGNNISLTNIAGVTEWFNADTAGAGATGTTRTYTRVLTDGTTTTLDHQDAHTLTTEPPAIVVRKEVNNVTAGQTPGLTATPGDELLYTITITNQGTIALPNFSVTDEVDSLNGAAMFAADSLRNIVVSIPADITNTDPAGGTYGSGLLDVRNLSLGEAGSGTETITITFNIDLAPSIIDGTIVYNQAELLETNAGTIPSDYEGDVNGNDPTPITITSAPLFQVQKISDDITGLPNELQAGDTLRYTITVKNIGTEDAVNTSLRDLVPTNTTYVANSTTLNGNPIADPAAGVSPLESGILVNAPEDITPGNMSADATTTTTNVATIVFDVTINAGVLDGTVISNQGYVNADGSGSGPITEQPSDDPDTIIPDDPTLDIVGVLPLVDAQKTVELYDDVNNDGDIDPGDTLRYTIIVTNSGAVPATGVRLVDAVPVNTTYVDDSTYLNTEPVTDPAVGVSPLVAGIDISSADQTPPLPTAGNGYLSVGGAATIRFDVIIDAAVPAGTIISNQGVVSSNEQADEPTDADGDDSNGDQPTLSVVGDVEQLSILKQVSVVGGGPALAGSELEYVVTVTNIGLLPATDVVITDDLSLPVAGQKSFIINSATMNGIDTGVSYTAPVIRAEYSTNYGDLLPGQVITLRFRVLLDSALVIGTTVTNIADVYWDDPDPGIAQSAQASVSIDIGATPGFGTLSGQAWHDADFDNELDAGERILAGWTVELHQNGNLIGSVLTDTNGIYQIDSVPPNYISLVPYEIRFIAPGATTTTALLGYADADPLYGYTNGLQYISDIVDIAPGVVRTNLNLPIDPNGVIYNSVVRTPVAGATLTMTDIAGSVLPDNCFVDTAQQGQVTLVDGYYKFDINFSQPECPPGSDYIIRVTPPANDYIAGASTIIPTSSSVATPYSVPTCPGDPLPTAECEVQTFETAPAVAIAAGAAETDYYLHLTLSDGVIPADSQIFNNHIPIDPDLALAIGISKVTPLVNVTRGELVPYTITISNTLPVPLNNVTLTDSIPAGFKYVEKSARLDGAAVEPTVNGLQLNWVIPTVDAEARYIVKLLLVVGAGVQEGEYINRAQAFSTLLNSNVSEEASATVRVVPDPVFDCSDIIGKVYDDKNLNGHQDKNETGIQGVRMATARGLLVTTDKHGRFHITCAATPDEQRGSNFILKLDERTLPSGYRVTTENPRVQRLTRGKMIKFNFGATVHRVVRLDIADGVFEKDSGTVRPQWLSRVDLLIKELRKAPSVLRLTYLGDVESAGLVDDRLETLRDLIEDKWDKVDSYKLVIEQEIFWRSGGPSGGGGLD